MSSPVTDLMEYINEQVGTLSTSALPAITEVLDAAELELSQALANWTALGKGLERFTPQMYGNALAQIRGALAEIRGGLAEGVASSLRHGGTLAAGLATKHLVKTVADMSALFQGTVRPIPIEAATVLAEGKSLVWKRFSNSAKRYAGQVGEDIRKQLAIGVVRGETIDQLTNRLVKLGGPKGLVYTRGQQYSPGARAEMISEGLFVRYRHFAERLAVTETVNAYNEFAMVGMDELEAHDPGYFKKWDAALDSRTCPNCKEFDDLIVPIDGLFRGRIEHPPLHPYCRCATVVWRKEWKEGNYKDDLIGESIKAEKSGGVLSVPHRINVAQPKAKQEPVVKSKSKGFDQYVVTPKDQLNSIGQPVPAGTVLGKYKTKEAAERSILKGMHGELEAEVKSKAEHQAKIPLPKPTKIPFAPTPSPLPTPKPEKIPLPPPVKIPLKPSTPVYEHQPEFGNKQRFQYSQVHNKFEGTLTKEESAAANWYQRAGYTDINGHHRKTDPAFGEVKQRVLEATKHLDTAIQKNEIKEPMMVYRGMNWQVKGLKKGAIVIDSGYMSTTINQKATEEFGGVNRMLHIEVPAGRHAAPISPLDSKEAEYLFPRNTRLEILSVTKVEGVEVIRARMLTHE